MDEAGRLALGRDAERHDRALAETGSRRRARSARSSTTSSTSPRRSSRRPACRRRVSVNGVQQRPLEGVSMAYTFDDASAADRHTTQYFEMFCNRGIYHEGWTAVTRHSIPWVANRDAGVRRRRLGALRRRTTGRRRTTSPPSKPEKLARAAAPVPDRGGEVQRPAARRPPVRALQRRDWPAGRSSCAATRSSCSAAWAG